MEKLGIAVMRRKKPPKGKNEAIIHLAEELFRARHGKDPSKKNPQCGAGCKKRKTSKGPGLGNTLCRNCVVEEWIRSPHFKAFRKILSLSKFKKHKRLRGDPSKLTLDDILFFISEDRLFCL